MGQNCAPWVADLFLYLKEVELYRTLLKFERRFISVYKYYYIDGILSRKTPKFGNFGMTLHIELKIKDTIYSSISYL